jgi:GWxTD domain-containing protein
MVLLLVCTLWLSPGPSSSSLKDWINGPVSIVLSDVEKKTFAELSSDEERQHFIDAFWTSRAENDATGNNSFKAEFQKRVETANTLFGGDAGMEGWRTERGRIYVLLGPPVTRAQFKSYGQLHPIELWFYSGKREYPQIPSFFYLMFFQRDEIGDYRRYSPFIDQPRSLVRGTRTNKEAYGMLAGINSELARASLSLLPGEPLDLESFSPSMTSDAVLSQINQIPRRDFEHARFVQELVRVKLKFAGTTAMTVYPFAVAPDIFTVDLAVERPEGIDDAKVETVVFRDGKEEGRTTGSFVKDAPLIGRLVLKAGDYTVEATVSDPAGKQKFVARDELHLKPAGGTLGVSDVLFFRSAKPIQASSPLPFTYRGYQFAAEAAKQFRSADKFQVLFQIAAPKTSPNTTGKISIDYTVAAINNAATRWTFHDDIGLDQFDGNGLLLNSKTLPIRDVPPGHYLLIILVRDAAGHRASQTVSFEVAGASGFAGVGEPGRN